MTNTNHMIALKSALVAAFSEGSSLLGSYLDNLGAYHYAMLTVLWKDCGNGNDSILGFAEKVRKA